VKKMTKMFFVTLVIGVAVTAQATPQRAMDGGRIAMDLDAGIIDDVEALWLSYQLQFEPQNLPARYDGGLVEGWSCGTGLVMDIKDNWERFTPEQRARMTAMLAPWKDDLLDPATEMEPPTGDRPPDDTCFGQYGDNRVQGDHFSVEWDGNTVSQATAESFLSALEYSWDVEVEELGWLEPEGSNQWLMLAYIAEGNYGGAYTTVDMCNNHYIPYIVAYEGSFFGGTWYQDMACHEFNHSMQFGYGYAHEFWWWEATATYIEEDVYPFHNSWAPYVSGYSDNPWMAMNTSSQQEQAAFNHMYGMSILAFYLDEHVAGEDFIRQTWDESSSYGGSYSLAIPDLMEDMGQDWREIYAGFIATNTVMEYHDQSHIPDIDIEERVDEGDIPASGQSSSSTEPESLGQNYIRFDADSATDDNPDLLVNFNGGGGETADWIALLVGTDDDKVEEVVDIELDEDANGEGRMVDFGRFDHVWLVVSPMGYADNGEDYEWEADAVPAIATGDDDDDDDDDDDGLDDDDDDGNGGCQCHNAASISAGGLLPLLGLMALVLRRRV